MYNHNGKILRIQLYFPIHIHPFSLSKGTTFQICVIKHYEYILIIFIILYFVNYYCIELYNLNIGFSIKIGINIWYIIINV